MWALLNMCLTDVVPAAPNNYFLSLINLPVHFLERKLKNILYYSLKHHLQMCFYIQIIEKRIVFLKGND